MNDATLLAHQVRYNQKAYWRNPRAAVFTVAFPIMFLVIFGSLNRNQRIDYLGNVHYNQYFIAGIIAYGVMGATFSNLSLQLVLARETGLLKRLRGTPLPTWTYMSGLVGNCLVVATILVVFVTALAVLFFGVHFYPARLLALVVTIALAVVCFSLLGIVVSSLVPNQDTALPVINIFFFLLLFVSGVFFPLQPGTALEKAAHYLPTWHFVQAIWHCFDPRTTGSGFSGNHLLVLACWTVGAAIVGLRRFKWEPARG